MKQLSMQDSFKLLRKYKLPFLKPTFVHSEKDVSLIRKFPVVLKVDSPEIVHKSDVGAVALNVRDQNEAKEKTIELLSRVSKKVPKAHIFGVVSFPQVEGSEFIIGVKRDPSFGLVVAFGSGGILVNLVDDASLFIGVPTLKQARTMIDSIKGRKILEGIRGLPRANKSELARLIVSTAKLMDENPSIKELDFNPVMITNDGLVIADVRFLV